MKYIMEEKFTHPVGIAAHEVTEKNLELLNYPNPFSGETTLAFSLNQADEVTISLYNMQGIEVSMLVNRRFEKGAHSIKFASGNLPSGIYQAVLHTPASVVSRQMVLIR
jgi:hypothetical protein